MSSNTAVTVGWNVTVMSQVDAVLTDCGTSVTFEQPSVNRLNGAGILLIMPISNASLPVFFNVAVTCFSIASPAMSSW